MHLFVFVQSRTLSVSYSDVTLVYGTPKDLSISKGCILSQILHIQLGFLHED